MCGGGEMIKYFCDVCGKEILPKTEDAKRLIFKHMRLTVEIITAIDDTWNAGNVCHDCIRLAVALSADKNNAHSDGRQR